MVCMESIYVSKNTALWNSSQWLLYINMNIVNTTCAYLRQPENSTSTPSADFRLIRFILHLSPSKAYIAHIHKKALVVLEISLRHLWFMPATRYHGGRLFHYAQTRPFHECNISHLTVNWVSPTCGFCFPGILLLNRLKKRGMRWNRPVALDPITDFGSPHDIYDNDIKIRHYEQRRTWAVGGIHPIPGKDQFQFFVLHNSWLPTVRNIRIYPFYFIVTYLVLLGVAEI